jgi:hypothetical protein
MAVCPGGGRLVWSRESGFFGFPDGSHDSPKQAFF